MGSLLRQMAHASSLGKLTVLEETVYNHGAAAIAELCKLEENEEAIATKGFLEILVEDDPDLIFLRQDQTFKSAFNDIPEEI